MQQRHQLNIVAAEDRADEGAQQRPLRERPQQLRELRSRRGATTATGLLWKCGRGATEAARVANSGRRTNGSLWPRRRRRCFRPSTHMRCRSSRQFSSSSSGAARSLHTPLCEKQRRGRNARGKERAEICRGAVEPRDDRRRRHPPQLPVQNARRRVGRCRINSVRCLFVAVGSEVDLRQRRGGGLARQPLARASPHEVAYKLLRARNRRGAGGAVVEGELAVIAG